MQLELSLVPWASGVVKHLATPVSCCWFLSAVGCYFHSYHIILLFSSLTLVSWVMPTRRVSGAVHLLASSSKPVWLSYSRILAFELDFYFTIFHCWFNVQSFPTLQLYLALVNTTFIFDTLVEHS